MSDHESGWSAMDRDIERIDERLRGQGATVTHAHVAKAIAHAGDASSETRRRIAAKLLAIHRKEDASRAVDAAYLHALEEALKS